MNNKKILLLDTSSIFYSLAFTLQEAYIEDLEKLMVYGFFDKIKKLCLKFNTNKIVFCYDSHVSKRKELLPSYKLKEKTEEEKGFLSKCFSIVPKIRKEFLPAIGFTNNFICDGFESDDIIASIVLNNRDEFVIVSEDSDFYQLLDFCSIYKPISKKSYSERILMDEHGLLPDQWVLYRALRGGKDNIKGIVGIGDVKAKKFVKGEIGPDNKDFKTINSETGKQILTTNLTIYTLPLPGTPKFPLNWETTFNPKYLNRDMMNYGIVQHSGDYTKWKQILS